MLQRAVDPRQLRRRASGGVTRRFLWVLTALGGVSVLGLGTAAGLTHVLLPKVATFVGELKDTSEVQTLGLPTGVAVQTLMVHNGNMVTKGQTLVRLDVASIVAEIQRVEAKALVYQQLLACLQSLAISTLPTLVAEAAISDATTDAKHPAHFADAALECAQISAPYRVALDALDANDAILALHSTLIDRRIKLELARVASFSSDRDNRARLVLGLAWEQTRIEGNRAANRQRRHDVSTKALATLTERARQVRADLQQTAIELADLARLQQDPRLISPADAIILNAAETAPGQVFGHPTPLINLVPTGPERFDVRLAVSALPAVAMRENAVVQIELIGTAMNWPSLTGRVSGMESGPAQVPDGALQVRIALEPESAAALAEMSAQSGFVRDGSALAVQAIMPEQPLATAMIMAWTEAAVDRTMQAP